MERLLNADTNNTKSGLFFRPLYFLLLFIYFFIDIYATFVPFSINQHDSCSLTNPGNNVSFVTNHPQALQPVAELSLIARINMLRAPLRSL